MSLGYLGTLTWTTALVEQVRTSTLQGMSFEGVIGKSGGGAKRTAIKAKSDNWKKKVIEVCGEVQGRAPS